MKKTLLGFVLFAALLPVNHVNAQAHEKGDLIISPYIGLGYWNYYYGRGFSRRGIGYSFPVGLNFDIAVHDYVDVGPYAGFVINSRNLGINFGARANFNWWQLLDEKVNADLKGDVLDIYYTLGFGYEVNTDFPNNYFRWSSALGVRWYFAERIALMGELGAPVLAPVHLGISFKLN